MDVGNDPFPRDEVTGLAAFENLEPVSGMNVVPEEPPPQPAAMQPAARTFSRPIGVSPVHAPATNGGADSDRQDKTEILTLNGAEQVVEEDESSDDGYGWEDDAATSILTPAAFRMPSPSPSQQHAAPPAASLDMDWDEDEPPTRMRDDLPFLPPLGGASARGSSHDSWTDEESGQPDAVDRFDDLASAGYVPPDLPVPTPPVGRPSPFPQANVASNRTYLAPIATPLERGGAPSPFSGAVTSDLPTGTDSFASSLAGRPPWQLVTAGAGVMLVLFLIGRLVFGGSSTGNVTLTTAPSDAQVLIDGKPAVGTSSPYSVSDLAVGSHELVVQKPGFSEYRSTFNVEKGESRALPMVELASKKVDSGFAVNSMPSGADISVDGAATGKTTPSKVSGIAPGVHKLQLQLAGHSPFELSILVPDTGVLQLPTAELTETSVAAATTPKAKSEREPREPREAREPREHREREPKEVSLTSTEKPRRSHADAEPVAARPEPAPKSSGGASGMLRLNSRPWSQVFVDGRLVGNTPQMGLPLSNGNHSVRLVNAQMGLTKTFSVQIKTGQMVTKVVNLVE
jgi:hypothetical protein